MISLQSITKEFKNNRNINKVFTDINLEINRGEFVTIFGPNGSGKTTLLNIIAGLDKKYLGKVLVDNKNPKDASIGFVFQNYNESLFPWYTVFDNIALPLDNIKIPKNKQKVIINKLLKEIGLLDHANKFIYELSGGQKQLVSICRAIAINPDVLIIDEPFSALDYLTTRRMELKLLDIWQEKKITTVFVSHDIDEAIFLADRIVVLSERPSIIKKILPVNLPRPRTFEMLSDPLFLKLRNNIIDLSNYEK